MQCPHTPTALRHFSIALPFHLQERPEFWRLNAEPAQEAFAAVASAISRFEPVTVMTSARQVSGCDTWRQDSPVMVRLSPRTHLSRRQRHACRPCTLQGGAMRLLPMGSNCLPSQCVHSDRMALLVRSSYRPPPWPISDVTGSVSAASLVVRCLHSGPGIKAAISFLPSSFPRVPASEMLCLSPCNPPSRALRLSAAQGPSGEAVSAWSTWRLLKHCT